MRNSEGVSLPGRLREDRGNRVDKALAEEHQGFDIEEPLGDAVKEYPERRWELFVAPAVKHEDPHPGKQIEHPCGVGRIPGHRCRPQTEEDAADRLHIPVHKSLERLLALPDKGRGLHKPALQLGKRDPFAGEVALPFASDIMEKEYLDPFVAGVGTDRPVFFYHVIDTDTSDHQPSLLETGPETLCDVTEIDTGDFPGEGLDQLITPVRPYKLRLQQGDIFRFNVSALLQVLRIAPDMNRKGHAGLRDTLTAIRFRQKLIDFGVEVEKAYQKKSTAAVGRVQLSNSNRQQTETALELSDRFPDVQALIARFEDF